MLSGPRIPHTRMASLRHLHLAPPVDVPLAATCTVANVEAMTTAQAGRNGWMSPPATLASHHSFLRPWITAECRLGAMGNGAGGDAVGPMSARKRPSEAHHTNNSWPSPIAPFNSIPMPSR